MDRATKAGFPAKNPNYKTQPQNMLLARATAECARLGWYGPLAWDDNIDAPAAQPDCGTDAHRFTVSQLAATRSA
ncbi:hypothetical protein KBZ21_41155, partial [Streptomyces sp. A73]|nr:hypothetical protein [Streptomyces sp. A73]